MPGTTRYSATFDRPYSELDSPPYSSSGSSRTFSPQGLDRLSASTDSLEERSNCSSSHSRQVSEEGSDFVGSPRPLSAGKPIAPKPPGNALQFVKVGPANLYKQAQEQVQKEEIIKKRSGKDEEEAWQSNLDNWRSSRRKRQEHIFERVAEMKKLEEEEHEHKRRKSKTFSQMLQGSGHRKLSMPAYLEDDDDDFRDLGLSSHNNNEMTRDSLSSDTSTERRDSHDDEKNSEDESVYQNGHNMTTNGYKNNLEEYTYEKAIQDYVSYTENCVKGKQSEQLVNGNDSKSKNSTAVNGDIKDKKASFEDSKPAVVLRTKAEVTVTRSDVEKRRSLFENKDSHSGSKIPVKVTRRYSEDTPQSLRDRVASFEKTGPKTERSEAYINIPSRDPEFHSKLSNFKQIEVEEEKLPKIQPRRLSPPVKPMRNNSQKPPIPTTRSSVQIVNSNNHIVIGVGISGYDDIPAIDETSDSLDSGHDDESLPSCSDKISLPKLPLPVVPLAESETSGSEFDFKTESETQSSVVHSEIKADLHPRDHISDTKIEIAETEVVRMREHKGELRNEENRLTVVEVVEKQHINREVNSTSLYSIFNKDVSSEDEDRTEFNDTSSMENEPQIQLDRLEEEPSLPDNTPAPETAVLPDEVALQVALELGEYDPESEVVGSGSPQLFLGLPSLGLPPSQKPPPPPPEEDGKMDRKQTQNLRRADSTKRIRKEMRQRRSDFLGISKEEQNLYTEDPVLSIAKPPNMNELLQKERELARQARERLMKDEKERREKEEMERKQNEDEEKKKEEERRKKEEEEKLKQQEELLRQHEFSDSTSDEDLDSVQKAWKEFEQRRRQVEQNSTTYLTDEEIYHHEKAILEDLERKERERMAKDDVKENVMRQAELDKLHEEMQRDKEKLLAQKEEELHKQALLQEKERLRKEQEQLRYERELFLTQQQQTERLSTSLSSLRMTPKEEVVHKTMPPTPPAKPNSLPNTPMRPSPQQMHQNHPQQMQQNHPQQMQQNHPQQMQQNLPQQLQQNHQQQLQQSHPQQKQQPQQTLPQQNRPQQTRPPLIQQASPQQSHPQQLSRPTFQALAAAPKPRLINSDTWVAQRKSDPPRSHYSNHWIMQEAEHRRVTELQQRLQTQGAAIGATNCSRRPETLPMMRSHSHANVNSIITSNTTQNRNSGGHTYVNMEQQALRPFASSESLDLHTSQPQIKRGESQEKMLSVSGRKKCSHCAKELGRGAAMIIESLSLCYHLECFRCCVCNVQLGNGTVGTDVRVHNQRLHCHDCYSNEEGLKFSRV